MTAPDRQQSSAIKRSEQDILNSSFDEVFSVLSMQNLSFNGTSLIRTPSPLFSKPFDRIIITYTDDTKATISTIVTKLAGVTQETLTNSSTTTVDDFART